MEIKKMGSNKMPKCQCPGCNNLGIYKFAVRRRGNGNAFLCEYHKRSLESYFTENSLRIGNMKQNGLTYSIELECSFVSFRARLELCVAGFLPTSDSTVTAEFKSPIYNGMNGLKAFLPSIQDLIDADDFRIGRECGTHFHVGHDRYINRLYMSYIRRYYHSLFLPLSNACQQYSDKATEIFGRDFGYWAGPIRDGINPEEHTNFVNVQHDYTIEFRRCFFKNAEQYARCADMCREITEKVIFTFCTEVERLGLREDQRLNAEEKAALKKAADKAAKQIVKAFMKA